MAKIDKARFWTGVLYPENMREDWKRYQIAAAILVYLVCQICGCDTVSGMPDRGLKGAKAPSQVSKVSRQAITLGNLQSTDKTYEVCL